MPTDVSGFDPITVSLRDYIDGAHAAHENAHARERENVKASLDAHDRLTDTVVADHFAAHAAAHEAVTLAFNNAKEAFADYKQSHTKELARDREAVRIALDAVERLSSLHAIAHEREHNSHETVHQREREAAGLAREDLDNRLHELDSQRVQLRDQAIHFMTRNEIVALIDRVSIAQEAQAKSADGAHARMDTNSQERTAGLQMQLDKLNIASAATSGASQRTTYLIGFGFTFITIVIALIGVYLSSRHAITVSPTGSLTTVGK